MARIRGLGVRARESRGSEDLILVIRKVFGLCHTLELSAREKREGMGIATMPNQWLAYRPPPRCPRCFEEDCVLHALTKTLRVAQRLHLG